MESPREGRWVHCFIMNIFLSFFGFFGLDLRSDVAHSHARHIDIIVFESGDAISGVS
jgi:hypothetical protein